MALAVEQGGSKQAVGKRPLLTRSYESVGGKEVEKLTFSDTYEWTSYADWGANFAALGASMVNWGGAKAGDSVVIYAETQMEWMLACQAAYSQSLTVVTIYATLGEEGVLHGCAQTKAPLMVLDAKLMGKVAGAIKKDRSQMKHLKKVIFIPDPCRSADPKAAAVIDAGLKALEKAGVQIEEIGKLITDGMKSLGVPAAPPKPDDLAVIMYTSGTTGLPKGVKISHRSMVAVIGGMVEKMVGYGVDPASKAQETYLAYLPLAHIMEMVVEMQLLSIGARLAYGSPHTLTPTGVKLKTGTCQGDAFCASPTIMVFAPAVLDKVFAGLNAKIAAGSPAVQKLFKWGLAAGEKNWDQGIVGSHWLYQKIVFKKVQAMLGGKVKLAFTGSAPLAPHVQKFVQTAFNCPVRQGYGLTETCAATCVGEACDNTTSVIGPPTSSNCVKLEDWAEGALALAQFWRLAQFRGIILDATPSTGNYFFADKDKPGVGMPRGEILIGGPCVCNGYFVDKANPDADVVKKNKEDFFVDPKSGYTFFHTGDIGQITARRLRADHRPQEGPGEAAAGRVRRALEGGERPQELAARRGADVLRPLRQGLLHRPRLPARQAARRPRRHPRRLRRPQGALRERGGGRRRHQVDRRHVQGEARRLRGAEEDRPRRRAVDAGQRPADGDDEAQAPADHQEAPGAHRQAVRLSGRGAYVCRV